MQKNFVQRHALFFSVIVFCFVIVPFIRNAYAQEKADKKQQAETLVIRTQKQAEEKKVTKRRVVLDAADRKARWMRCDCCFSAFPTALIPDTAESGHPV